MLRILFTRRWLAALAAAAVFCTACIFLGRWQWGRYEGKVANADRVTRYYEAPPVPLGDVVPPGSPPLPQEQEWRRVEMTGTYAGDEQLMVRNRPQDAVYGYEVLVPLRLPQGDAILVDRGWVQNAERADVLPQVPPAPGGQVTVTGWLRPGEPEVGGGLPEGQLASIDLGRAQSESGLPLRPAYVVLGSEDDGSGRNLPRPAPLLPPDTDLGPHLAYAIQWWGASPVGFVLLFVYLRREYQDSQGIERPPKPKKVRIWDEEDA